MKAILAWIAGIVALFGIIFGLNVMGMFSKEFFGKWNEQIRYDIHKESQSYRDGMQRELGRIQMEWSKADLAGRIGIEAHVRDVYSQTDTSEYPNHLKSFLSQIGVY